MQRAIDNHDDIVKVNPVNPVNLMEGLSTKYLLDFAIPKKNKADVKVWSVSDAGDIKRKLNVTITTVEEIMANNPISKKMKAAEAV